MNRRELIGLLASGIAAKGMQVPVDEQRTVPLICLQSACLKAIEYPELADIARQLGAEGVDLTIMPGGHVEPRNSSVDLIRALEVMQGQGLEVPLITTALITPTDYTARAVLALSGMSGVAMFQPGVWPRATSDSPARLAQVRRDIIGLANIGREYHIGPALGNRPGSAVETVSDALTVVNGLNVRAVGLCFDPAHAMMATGAWEAELQLALPKLRAVSIRDVTAAKPDAKYCALGKGVLDAPRFIEALARAGFAGPLSVHVDYQTRDIPGSVERDLALVKKAVRSAYARHSQS
jgi:L-ribulose-5-phosphate 3-epimerase